MVNNFSLVIPAYDEEENLPILMKEIDEMLQKSGLSCEILFINDGSKDHTLDVMLELPRQYPQHKIRVISLDKNYGLSAALDAGYRTATSDVVVSIDSDLQNDPADIPRLLEKIPEYDVVLGVRARRQDSFVKTMSSRIANRIRNSVTGEKIRDTGCTLKAYKRSYLLKIKMFTGMHRFLPSLLELEGAKIYQLEVNHRPRVHGKAKYYLSNRLVGPFLDLLAVAWMKKKHFRYNIEEKVPR